MISAYFFLFFSRMMKKLSVQVVINYGNFKLLFCRRMQGIVLKCVLHVQDAYLATLEQSNS